MREKAIEWRQANYSTGRNVSERGFKSQCQQRDKISVSEYLRKKNGTKLIGESQKRLKYLLSKDIMKLF